MRYLAFLILIGTFFEMNGQTKQVVFIVSDSLGSPVEGVLIKGGTKDVLIHGITDETGVYQVEEVVSKKMKDGEDISYSCFKKDFALIKDIRRVGKEETSIRIEVDMDLIPQSSSPIVVVPMVTISGVTEKFNRTRKEAVIQIDVVGEKHHTFCTDDNGFFSTELPKDQLLIDNSNQIRMTADSRIFELINTPYQVVVPVDNIIWTEMKVKKNPDVILRREIPIILGGGLMAWGLYRYYGPNGALAIYRDYEEYTTEEDFQANTNYNYPNREAAFDDAERIRKTGSRDFITVGAILLSGAVIWEILDAKSYRKRLTADGICAIPEIEFKNGYVSLGYTFPLN